MSFYVAKILTLLMQPLLVAVIAITAGVVLLQRGTRPRLGAAFAWSGLGYIFFVGLSPISNAMLLPLEDRFPPATLEAGTPIEGIIVLGGFEDGWVSEVRGGLQVNESADRLTETARLARRFPSARIVFTGGVGKIWGGGAVATGPVKQFLMDMGVAEERIVLEGKSRNTYENALYSAEILKPTPEQRWVLVTSASHMPRAVGLYRKAGFSVIPFPVDYKTRDEEDMWRPFERIPQGLSRFDTAFNEWAGLIAYRALGRLDDLFPGP